MEISLDRLKKALIDLGGAADREVVVYDRIDSTSTDLKRRLAAGAAPGTVVTAVVQESGRGRKGRYWCSHHPGNFYLSLAVSLTGPGPDTVPMLPLVAGIAAHEAVKVTSGVNAALKWPNDLLVEGRKLAGILTESTSLRPDRTVAVVGFGLNISQSQFPEEIAEIATSIVLQHRRLPEIEAVAARFVHELERRVSLIEQHQQSAIVEGWLDRAEPFGRRVRVGAVEGVTRGLAPDGRLLILDTRGEEVPVAGGIVEPLD